MGDVSRRAVLGGGVATLGVVVLGVGPAVAATKLDSIPLRADYLPAVGKVFTAHHAGHTFRLKLTKISNLSPTTAKQRSHSFILVFAPAGGLALRDGMYTLRHKGIHAHRLFLSGFGTDRRMQAVINRQH